MALKAVATITSIAIVFVYLFLLIFTSSFVCWFKCRPDDSSTFQSLPAHGFIHRRSAQSCDDPPEFYLMPMPNTIQVDEQNRVIALPQKVQIKSSKILPFLPSINSSDSNFVVSIDYTSSPDEFIYPALNLDESYTLRIESETQASLTAPNPIGILRGLATLEQILYQKRIRIPVLIKDRPRFPWRGLMLDVARHYIPIELIKKTIDRMYLVKMNVLHLHLSDDQGFRFESKIFDRLHDRNEFYSQIQIKQIIEYARQRAIRVVPEFDIPGHTTSWFVGYPHLGTGIRKSYMVESRWGVLNATMDVTQNSTYDFLDKFFHEVSQIFPDPFIHIGGDETVPFEWGNSKTIRDFMLKENIRDFHDLQAFFNQRLNYIIEKYNRTMMGWDEVYHSQLKPQTVVQVWRGKEVLHRLIYNGYHAVVSHGFYLDHMRSSKFHYENDLEIRWPSLAQFETSFLGGEACLWTEYIGSHMLESRLWPRTAAIAERLWTMKHDSIPCMYQRLDHLDKIIFQSNDEQLMKDLSTLTSNTTTLRLLADFCEPLGLDGRNRQLNYTKDTALNRLVDFLPPESEATRKLTQSGNVSQLYSLFTAWINNEIFLRGNHPEIVQLSYNLARIGEFGIRLLHVLGDSSKTRIVSSRWYHYHLRRIADFEYDVPEFRLAAVQIVKDLLMEFDPCAFDVINLIILMIFPVLVMIVHRVTFIQKRVIRPCRRRFYR